VFVKRSLPSFTRAWQIPTGAHLKTLPKQTHMCSKPTVPSPTIPQDNDFSCQSLNPPKKKKKLSEYYYHPVTEFNTL